MPNKLQIGTLAYKQNEKYVKTIPLLIEETEQLKIATSYLLNVAYEMIFNDLMNYCTNTSGLCAENRLVKENK